MTHRARVLLILLSAMVAPILLTSRTAAQRGPAQPAATPAANPPERFTVPSDGHPMAVWARRPSNPRERDSARARHDVEHAAGLRLAGARAAAIGHDQPGGAGHRGVRRGPARLRRDATRRDGLGDAAPRGQLTSSTCSRGSPHSIRRCPSRRVAGWSRGGAISMMAAQMAPTRVSALVLFGFLFDPEAQFADVPVPAKPQMEKNTAEAAASDFISPAGHAARGDQRVHRAGAQSRSRFGSISRTTASTTLLKPDRVTVPTLVMYGQQDPGVSDADAGKFFAKLARRRSRNDRAAGRRSRGAARRHPRHVDFRRRQFSQSAAGPKR